MDTFMGALEALTFLASFLYERMEGVPQGATRSSEFGFYKTFKKHFERTTYFVGSF